MSQKFIINNDSFICEVCSHKNPPAPKTCRNHCRKCLHSKHVDNFPGDRAAECGGIFKPVGIELAKGEMSSLQFLCKKCGKTGRNKIAEDDDRDALLAVIAG